jgi:hypothetical protein
MCMEPRRDVEVPRRKLTLSSNEALSWISKWGDVHTLPEARIKLQFEITKDQRKLRLTKVNCWHSHVTSSMFQIEA